MKNYFLYLFRAYIITAIVALYVIAVVYAQHHYGNDIMNIVMLGLAPFVVVTITELIYKWLNE